MLASLREALPPAAKIQRHQKVKRLIGVAGKDERGQTGTRHRDPDLRIIALAHLALFEL